MTNEQFCLYVSDKAFRWQPLLGDVNHPYESSRIVVVSKEWFGNFYGRVVIPVTCGVTKTKDSHFVTLIFQTIDDGPVSLLGPHESLDKAKKRYERLLSLTYEMWMIPSREELEKLCQETGLYLSI